MTPSVRSSIGRSDTNLNRPSAITPRTTVGQTGRGDVTALRPIGVAPTGRSLSNTGNLSHGGPRLGVAGYGSAFTRYSPRYHRPDYWRHHGYSHFRPYHYGHHGHHHSSFSFGFGFYNSCYAYPAYPLAYYPTYYYPVYSAAVVPAPVVVQQPVVSYYPAEGTVVTGQYATADAYMAGTGTVQAPDVNYAAPQYESSQVEVPQAEEPQAQAPRMEMPRSQAPQATVENNMPSYSQSVPPSSAYTPAPVTPPTTVTPPLPAEPAPSEVTTPAESPQAETFAPGQAAPSESAVAQPQLAMPAEKLQQLMVNGTQAFGEGRYADSADAFGQVSKADPQNVDAALAYGVAQFAAGNYSVSAEAIRNGVSLFPPIVDSVFDLRERYSKVSDFVGQTGKLEEFVNKNPRNADALLVLGFVRHFSEQRDLARQIFEQIKKDSSKDALLADVFLNAMTPEQTEAALKASEEAAKASESAIGNATGQPSAVSVTTQPGGVDDILSGPASPGVLSVTTRPAGEMQKVELPTDPVFKGRMSLQGELPREQTTVDGILVRLKGTDDDPPKASLEIIAGDKRLKVSNFQPGARVEVKGESGQMYRMVLTEVNNQTETISFLIAK